MASTVLLGSDCTGVFGSAVAQLVSMTIGESIDSVDITNLDSTKAENLKDSLTKEGTFTFSAYVNAGHSSLFGQIDDTTSTSLSITMPESDGSGSLTGSSSGKIYSYTVNGIEKGGVVQAEFSVQLDTDVSWS